MHADTAPNPIRIAGHTLVLFAFDIGFQINLDAAGTLLRDSTRQRVVRARRPAPVWFDYAPPPLRLIEETDPVTIGACTTDKSVEILVYDFGAALLTYKLPLPATLAELPTMSVALYDQKILEADARARVRRLVEAIRPAIERPDVDDAAEDYVVFAVTDWDESLTPARVIDAHRELLARSLEAEPGALAPDQVARTLEAAISYAPSDCAIIDWNTAILFDRAPEDVVAVLQHANVELLELRVLDQELDAILDKADETLSALVRRRVWPTFVTGRMLRRVATAQTDAAVMFEGVNNAIKLLGNQYLARLYRLAASRLDLPAWQRSVQRKLDATEILYQKMTDAASIRRTETLEWIIIILIAMEIVFSFIPH